MNVAWCGSSTTAGMFGIYSAAGADPIVTSKATSLLLGEVHEQ